MMRYLVAVLLAALFSGPAHALPEDTGEFEGLAFVAETRIPGPDGAPLSLCHRTENFRIMGVTLVSNALEYVLSSDDCTAQITREFSAQQMETAQSLNLVDPALPAVARNSLQRNVQNAALWVALILAVVAVIIRRIKSLMGRDLRRPMRKKASDRLLTVLCYVGKCDGLVSSKDIGLIVATAQRLTRRTVRSEQVIHISDHIDLDLSMHDFVAFGRGLRDNEKDIMMRGAFYVALASGRILPIEHAFLSDLAHGIGMPGEDFRRVMNDSLMDLDLYPPD